MSRFIFQSFVGASTSKGTRYCLRFSEVKMYVDHIGRLKCYKKLPSRVDTQRGNSNSISTPVASLYPNWKVSSAWIGIKKMKWRPRFLQEWYNVLPAMRGRPYAMASQTTLGSPSSQDGWTRKSCLRKRLIISLRWSNDFHYFESPKRLISPSIANRYLGRSPCLTRYPTQLTLGSKPYCFRKISCARTRKRPFLNLDPLAMTSILSCALSGSYETWIFFLSRCLASKGPEA